MDYSFRPCHFDDLHDIPEVAISKLPKFSSGDSVAVKRHLCFFTRIMMMYCRPPRYDPEDVKMRLFVFSLEGDALNWFNNCPENSFTSLQDIVNAFKDRYGYPDSSLCAPKTVQQNEKEPAIGKRFQDNASYQNVPSTCAVTDQIYDNEKAETNDNEKEDQKQIIQELMLLVKNMEINQTKYANDVRTLCTHLEKRNREMEIMQNQHTKEIEAMKINHDTEIGFMQSSLSGLEENMTTMKANHDREINFMQNKLLTMEEEMTIMTFDHKSQLATMQANHKEEINSMQHCLMIIKEKDDKVIRDMEANQICLQKKLLIMEVDHTREIRAVKVEHFSQINQEPSHLSQQTPSYYEEVIGSIERDPDKLKNDKDQMQDEEKYVAHILHTSSKSFETESSISSVIQPATKKKRKRKKMRRRFDASDGREQLDFRIGKSPTICRIGHGTSDKQPTDLPESRQMLSMHYIEHI